ncbi:Oxoglutarate/iron-dependent dioxygenase [Parasponia andersonii]|uniref:Oxoglutarate/iron-dependent dioxygenase n=1 Tax=Parasponia andersonii TaxID=3476 RepID=A0A2P5DV36_PARAD|nr:Oxoglutarate/iron-dependent dioxygenase [Parasponia andersonii]
MAPIFNDGDSHDLFNFVVRDGYGVKGLVDLGLSRVPERYVQPPKERIEKSDATSHQEPPIDLSKLDGPDCKEAAEEIVRAAETLGFFQVVNHGVPVELLESLKNAAFCFFEQAPEKKAVFLKGASPCPYVKYGTSFAPEKEIAFEWKDYISMVYTNDADALSYWPQHCKEVALEYLKTSINMVKRILEVLIARLGVPVEDSVALIDALVDLKMVNMNFYPACPNPELTVGVGRHSDMGTLTVLLQDGIGGLYVKVEEDVDDDNNIAGSKGQWMEIPPISGALVINIGDTLQILSNGRYKSAEHRVRTTSTQSRVSVPIFTISKPKQMIGPLPQVVEKDGLPRYREVVFEDYMNNFFGNAHEGKKSLDFAKI